MNKKFVLALCLVFSSIYSFGQSARQYIKAGQEFAKSQKYSDAVSQYTRAIELAPQKVDYYTLRAEAYEKMGNIALALEDINKAIVFKDNNDLRVEAGRLAFMLKDYDKANANLDVVLNKKSENVTAYEYKVRTLIAQQNFNSAQEYCEKALINKENATNFFLSAIILENLGNLESAEWSYKKAISKDKKFEDAYIALADLQIRLDKAAPAMELCETLMKINPNNTEAYRVRSKIYIKHLDFPSAINDISKAIIMKPEDEQLFFIRGMYYQQFTQYQNAINDFNKVLLINSKNVDALYQRASTYEQIANFKMAIKDYEALAALSEYDVKARKLLDVAKKRLYELNRETNAPVIKILDPVLKDKTSIELAKDKKELLLKGQLVDESDIETLQINGKNVPVVRNDDVFDFLASVNVDNVDIVSISTSDIYNNIQQVRLNISRTEINGPAINITAPYSSDNGEIYIDTSNPNIYVEGRADDESLIKSILIDGVSASYKLDEINPVFSANIDISNKNKIAVLATDIYGNQTLKEFLLNRDGANLLQNNPMGKTWVIFIENSNYQTFASLEGPVKDVSLMKSALAKYSVNNIIHKKDLSKKELEKFFSIELRDLVRSNRVDALMIWYAGHGKQINNTGYWIPVDANREDEFTYFNINSLKAGLQSYSEVKHLLVVTDACESGPTFYQAMRNAPKDRDCSDWKATRFKSSQVFSSAGYEIAADDSQFTRTFANALANNPNTCIPIENIVQKVTLAVGKNSQQKPQFGKIAGLEDEDGTFFFIAK